MVFQGEQGEPGYRGAPGMPGYKNKNIIQYTCFHSVVCYYIHSHGETISTFFKHKLFPR